MPRLVKDDGTGRERLVVIGEAPGQHEEIQGKPFVGPSGGLLAKWMREVGLSRRDVYWTNVYPYRPPNNKLEKVSHGDLAPWLHDLHQRLARLVDPWLVVPTGNTALRSLVDRGGIGKHRGSIYSYRKAGGRELKVIPTVHPAAIFRQPKWERRCQLDWRRISGDLTFRELRLPEREHYIKPSLDDCRAFLDDATQRAECLAVDIETPREQLLTPVTTTLKSGEQKIRMKRSRGAPRVTCVGFSFEPHFSLTIPTTESYWGPDLDTAWDIIRQLCWLPCEKVMQNGLFDAFWLLNDHGCALRNWRWDTRWLHHARDPLDEHSLAYMASVDTREPYWKDDHKDSGELDGEPGDLDVYWRYNGKDACVTRELADSYTANASGTYAAHYQSLYGPLLRLMSHGVTLDERARRRRATQILSACLTIQDKLAAIAGEPLHAKKDLSTQKLARYLYETLKLPRQIDRKTGGVTTKEVTVRKLMLKYPAKLGRDDEPEKPGRLILDYRRQSKLSSFVRDGVADDDGRVRCQYGFTNTGRLTSAKNPRRTGQNLQNVDRELRALYRPDPGCFFLEVDASQGEDRIVKCLTGAPRLIERARAAPWENDEHRRAAAIIYRKPVDAISKDERYIGKRVRHAGNYDMHGRKLSEELLKEGVVIDPDEGEAMIQGVIDKDTPEIRDYHRKIRQIVLRDRAIGCSCGYVVDYTYERLNDDLYRSAYALIPQHELVCFVNQWGLVPLDQRIRQNRLLSRINLQVHDSLVISTTREEAYDLAVFLKTSLERPRTYWGTRLTIPVEFKIGTSWEMAHEWKRFPARDEFMDRVTAMLA